MCQKTEIIFKSLIDKHEKWKAAQKRGTALCYSIENIKKKALEGNEKYPDDLEKFCRNLATITSIFEDISADAKISVAQMDKLKLLVRDKHEILFITWTFDNFLDTVLKICDAYEKEFEIKKIVMANIGHSKSKSELVLHTSVWEYPNFVNSNIDVLVKELCIELDIK